MLKTRLGQRLEKAQLARQRELRRIFEQHGAYLVDGHGSYPTYTTNAGLVLQKPDLVSPGVDRAVIYLAEPGKCMFIQTGRILSDRYFRTRTGILEFLSGKAERAGVHHADISRRAFVGGMDEFYDSYVDLKPAANAPSFGYVYKLPLRDPLALTNLTKNRVPKRNEVLNFGRMKTWVSDIIHRRPGVYIINSCLDIHGAGTNFNYPGAPRGVSVYAKEGQSPVKRKVMGAFRTPTVRVKSAHTIALGRVKKNVRKMGKTMMGIPGMRITPFPNSPNNFTKRRQKNERLKKVSPVKSVNTILKKLKNNANINLVAETAKLGANSPGRNAYNKLWITRSALRWKRKYPIQFKIWVAEHFHNNKNLEWTPHQIFNRAHLQPFVNKFKFRL